MAAFPTPTGETLLVTRRFSVERQVFPRPESEPLVREFVIHPGAAVVLPLLDDDRVVMIRQLRRGVGTELLELPAGTLEPDEPPIDTARRELEEETGFRAGRMEPLAEFFTSPGILNERMHAFLATDLRHVGQRLDDGETIELATMPLDEVRSLLVRGALHDGKTLATLGIYLARRDAGT